MNINKSDRFRCLVAIEQGGFTFEAGKVYFLKTRFDKAVSIYKGGGGIGNFTLSECNDHFLQVVQVKCTRDYKENEVVLYHTGESFDVADSGNDQFALYKGSETKPATITSSALRIHFKEVA